jgi:hypothetical protein
MVTKKQCKTNGHQNNHQPKLKNELSKNFHIFLSYQFKLPEILVWQREGEKQVG